MKKLRFTGSMIILSMFIGFASCSENKNSDDLIVDDGQTENYEDLYKSVVSFVPTDSLTEDEVHGLIWMREEEKLAMDVYDLFYEMYSLQIFDNISNSEFRHTESVLSLLSFYGIEDPALDSSGQFSDPELQQLYDDLVGMGSESEEEALKTGALIEEVDIIDLVEEMEATSNVNILRVYENLLEGSMRHLVAFVRNLEYYGISYSPQKLDEETYDEILSATTTGGKGKAKGNSKAKGRGKGNGNGGNGKGGNGKGRNN